MDSFRAVVDFSARGALIFNGGALALVLDGAGNFLRFVSVGAIHGLICSAKGMGGTCYIETGNLYFCGSDSKVPGFDSLCNFV